MSPREWKPAEDALLHESWSECVTRATICRRLGRSWRAAWDRMVVLGLSSIPQGYVGTMEACERLGLCPRTLYRIARRQRVTVNRSYGRSRNGRAIYEWDQLREAVESETSELETITGAARSRDVPVETLLTWLCSVGVHRRVRGRRRAIRLPSALFDTVVAWGRRGGRIRQALAHGKPVRIAMPDVDHLEAA